MTVAAGRYRWPSAASPAWRRRQRCSPAASDACRALFEAMSAAVLPEAAWRAIDPAGDTLRDIDTEADLA